MSTLRVVFTESRRPDEIKDEFYFSSPEKFGGGAAVGDQVSIISDVTHAVLAVGEIISKGKPYEECRTVRVIERFS